MYDGFSGALIARRVYPSSAADLVLRPRPIFFRLTAGAFGFLILSRSADPTRSQRKTPARKETGAKFHLSNEAMPCSGAPISIQERKYRSAMAAVSPMPSPPGGDPGRPYWFYGPDQHGIGGLPLAQPWLIPGFNPNNPF
jgi:hypothetical protein